MLHIYKLCEKINNKYNLTIMCIFSINVFTFFPQLGGTVGDIESMPFIEAFRQFQFKVKRENFCNIHVSLVPQVGNKLTFYI